MTPFIELPTVYMPFFCIAFLLASVTGLYCVIAMTVYRAPTRYTALCAAHLVCCLIPTAALTDGCNALYRGMLPSWMIVWLMRVPAVPFAICAALLLAASIRACFRLVQWRKEHISRMSIKESVDALPTGLCFCYSDSIPHLVNLRMNALCHAMTGNTLNDADDFWRTLTSGALTPGCERIRGDECPIIKIPDGTVWMFEQRWIEQGQVPVRQLTATNTTEEYQLGEQIKEENQRLNEIKIRLQRYGDTVREVSRIREILNAKVRIHDELGQALIASRRVLAGQVSRDELEAVATLWKRSVTVLNKGVIHEMTEDGYAQLTDAARAIGISIRWNGEKPREGTNAAYILQRMAHECLTNAVRHTGSTELYASVQRGHGRWTYICMNNGEAPHAPIREGGGLNGLRSRVEQVGGEMRIAHTPRFALTITISEEHEEEL